MKTRFTHLTPTACLRSAARAAGAAAVVLVIAACSTEIHVRGNQLDEESLALIKPGQQSREQVIQILGSPTTTGTFEDNTIYYISQRTKTVSYHRPEILSRTIVAINFDDSGRVAEVKKLGLEDGHDVKPVERTTPTPGRQFTVLQQLLGNFGRFERGEERMAE